MAHCPRYLQAVAACQLTPRPAHPLEMTTKSRQRIYGASIRASAQRAKEARKEADRLACEAWNMRLPGFTGPADKEERRGVVRSQRRQATVCVRWPRTEFKGD